MIQVIHRVRVLLLGIRVCVCVCVCVCVATGIVEEVVVIFGGLAETGLDVLQCCPGLRSNLQNIRRRFRSNTAIMELVDSIL